MLLDPLDRLPPSALHRIHVAQGETVFRQDDPTRGLFLVESGQVNLQRITPEGHPVTMHRATAGTLFAEASLHTDRYHCDAICIRPGAVLCIEKRATLDRMADDPAFSLAFARLLATQVQAYRQVVELLSIRSALDRTRAAVSLGYITGTVTEFASRIGLTQEACYRALRRLCNEGTLVQTARGKYALPAMKKAPPQGRGLR